MLKHILTTKCNRKCEYCITKNIKCEEKRNLLSVRRIYNKLNSKNKNIMLTGGEPTLAGDFYEILKIANLYFRDVYITTQSAWVLQNYSLLNYLSSISFSLHDINKIPKVEITPLPVYACILDKDYYRGLVTKLKKLGYSGLTINEEQRKGKRFKTKLPKSTKKFSIRINRKGKCLNEPMILPDLTIINNFKRYL